ncbi:MAG: hypothetical protein NT099_07570 [Candidatus Saganbacteria bacterium]|nr:hypothetical protein [Candidatus Saganbacteria bacterium]
MRIARLLLIETLLLAPLAFHGDQGTTRFPNFSKKVRFYLNCNEKETGEN